MIKKIQKRKIAKKISNCFRGYNWNIQTFITNGAKLEDKNGNKTFYATKDIDKCINKLNKLINSLSK